MPVKSSLTKTYTLPGIVLLILFLSMILFLRVHRDYKIDAKDASRNFNLQDHLVTMSHIDSDSIGKYPIYLITSSENKDHLHLTLPYKKLDADQLNDPTFQKELLNYPGSKFILSENISLASRIVCVMEQLGIKNVFIVMPDSISIQNIEKMHYSFVKDSDVQID